MNWIGEEAIMGGTVDICSTYISIHETEAEKFAYWGSRRHEPLVTFVKNKNVDHFLGRIPD